MKKIKNLKRGKIISQGAFGTVYQGSCMIQNKQIKVAIKDILQGSKSTSNKIQRQINIMKSINHQNILKLIDYQIKQFQTLLITQYLQYDLLDFIQNNYIPIKPEIIKSIWQQLLHGLAILKEAKIIHRDLKPSNVLINKKGIVKIADFGSAVFQQDKQKGGKFALEGFSKWYICPQILFGFRKYSYQVDLWSAGCILGELILGRPVFPGSTEIQQIVLIGNLLGSPDKENWPSIGKMPDFGKLIFKKKQRADFIDVFPFATELQIFALKNTLCYEAKQGVQSLLDKQFQIYQLNDSIKKYKRQPSYNI